MALEDEYQTESQYDGYGHDSGLPEDASTFADHCQGITEDYAEWVEETMRLQREASMREKKSKKPAPKPRSRSGSFAPQLSERSFMRRKSSASPSAQPTWKPPGSVPAKAPKIFLELAKHEEAEAEMELRRSMRRERSASNRSNFTRMMSSTLSSAGQQRSSSMKATRSQLFNAQDSVENKKAASPPQDKKVLGADAAAAAVAAVANAAKAASIGSDLAATTSTRSSDPPTAAADEGAGPQVEQAKDASPEASSPNATEDSLPLEENTEGPPLFQQALTESQALLTKLRGLGSMSDEEGKAAAEAKLRGEAQRSAQEVQRLCKEVGLSAESPEVATLIMQLESLWGEVSHLRSDQKATSTGKVEEVEPLVDPSEVGDQPGAQAADGRRLYIKPEVLSSSSARRHVARPAYISVGHAAAPRTSTSRASSADATPRSCDFIRLPSNTSTAATLSNTITRSSSASRSMFRLHAAGTTLGPSPSATWPLARNGSLLVDIPTSTRASSEAGDEPGSLFIRATSPSGSRSVSPIRTVSRAQSARVPFRMPSTTAVARAGSYGGEGGSIRAVRGGSQSPVRLYTMPRSSSPFIMNEESRPSSATAPATQPRLTKLHLPSSGPASARGMMRTPHSQTAREVVYAGGGGSLVASPVGNMPVIAEARRASKPTAYTAPPSPMNRTAIWGERAPRTPLTPVSAWGAPRTPLSPVSAWGSQKKIIMTRHVEGTLASQPTDHVQVEERIDRSSTPLQVRQRASTSGLKPATESLKMAAARQSSSSAFGLQMSPKTLVATTWPEVQSPNGRQASVPNGTLAQQAGLPTLLSAHATSPREVPVAKAQLQTAVVATPVIPRSALQVPTSAR